MTHLQGELLQRYLAGEADLIEIEQLEAHLAACDTCSHLLTQIAADDAQLAASLALDEAELAWAEGLDLTGPVGRQIRPWYRQPQTLLIFLPLVLLSSLIFHQIGQLIGTYLTRNGTVGTSVAILSATAETAWNLLGYLSSGGLLASLWPALVLSTALWLYQSLKKKEA